MAPLHFITVVWGAAYSELYLDVVLPSQLSPGNLLYFRDEGVRAAYKIYTKREDSERIRQAAIFSELSAVLPVEIILIDDVNIGEKYEALAECHRRAIKSADEACAALVFLSPDSIWSDGTFRNLCRAAAAGTQAVMVSGVRVVKETFVPAYAICHRGNGRASTGIQARELVKLSLDHLHPVTRSLFWDSAHFSTWPSHLYWAVDREGFVARCFHLHPLMVNPSRRGLLPRNTIDDDYIALACPDPVALHVVEDSDELVGCEISEYNQFGSFPPRKSSALAVALWAKYHARANHVSFSRRTIRFHHADLSERWRQAESRSDSVMNSIYFFLRFYIVFLGWRMVLRESAVATKRLLTLLLGEKRVRLLRTALKL